MLIYSFFICLQNQIPDICKNGNLSDKKQIVILNDQIFPKNTSLAQICQKANCNEYEFREEEQQIAQYNNKRRSNEDSDENLPPKKCRKVIKLIFLFIIVTCL